MGRSRQLCPTFVTPWSLRSPQLVPAVVVQWVSGADSGMVGELSAEIRPLVHFRLRQTHLTSPHTIEDSLVASPATTN